VETQYDSKERFAPATLSLTVNAKQVAQKRIERSVPAGHNASETFDRESSNNRFQRTLNKRY